MPNNGDTLVVKYSSLEAAANAIEGQSKQLEEDLAAIKSAIANVAGLWEGEAKTAYDTAQQGWDNDARAIHDALSNISRRVHDASISYRASDKRGRANFE